MEQQGRKKRRKVDEQQRETAITLTSDVAALRQSGVPASLTTMAFVDRQVNMIEQLLPEAMVHILSFMDIPMKLKLASMNRRLRTKVYQECSQAWIEIDLTRFMRRDLDRLTDFQVTSLLTNVNAREVTKVFKLGSCRLITAAGLEPLRNSRVLEKFEMCVRYRSNEDRLDADEVTSCLDVLRSMFPYKLHYWKFNVDDKNKPILLEFLRDFRSAKLRQAHGTTCDACMEPVVDEKRQLVPSLVGVPATQCSLCGGRFCKRSTCPVDMRECKSCNWASCSNCKGAAHQCHDCGHSYCSAHCHLYRYDPISYCGDKYGGGKGSGGCGKASCNECHTVCDCRGCDDLKCPNCCTFTALCEADWHEFHDWLLCEDCYAKDEGCFFCNTHMCEICWAVEECGMEGCDKRFCTECCVEKADKCVYCSRFFCKHHGALECKKCDCRHCPDECNCDNWS